MKITLIYPKLYLFRCSNQIMSGNYVVDLVAKLDNLMKEEHDELLILVSLLKASSDFFYALDLLRKRSNKETSNELSYQITTLPGCPGSQMTDDAHYINRTASSMYVILHCVILWLYIRSLTTIQYLERFSSATVIQLHEGWFTINMWSPLVDRLCLTVTQYILTQYDCSLLRNNSY